MFVVGIDAHTRYLVLVVVNKEGQLMLKPTRVVAGNASRLATVLAPFRPLTAVVETSSAWPWLEEVLQPLGITFVLAHARRLRAIAEANYKRDAVDAELLARMELAGLIPRVYPTPAPQREWATLLRHRAALVRERTVLVNRIHAQLHQVGLHLARGRLLTRVVQTWLKTEAWPQLKPEQRRLVRTHWRMTRLLTRLIRALDRRIATQTQAIPAARLLQSIPGIGPQRALTVCAEALPITRFATPNHFVSYAGLAPRTRASGEKPVRHQSIPAGANRWLRGTLVQAVVAHAKTAETSWLTQYYVQQKARVGWPTARIATARKLARAMHAMLRTDSPWQMSHPQASHPQAPHPQAPHPQASHPEGESSQNCMPH